MSRLLEVQHQKTINGITITDTTVNVLNDKGIAIHEHYVLKVSGRDKDGMLHHFVSIKMNKIQHLILKEKWIKKLKSVKTPAKKREYAYA